MEVNKVLDLVSQVPDTNDFGEESKNPEFISSGSDNILSSLVLFRCNSFCQPNFIALNFKLYFAEVF